MEALLFDALIFFSMRSASARDAQAFLKTITQSFADEVKRSLPAR
jgi:hypothetical protein